MPFQKGNRLGGRKKGAAAITADRLREFIVQKVAEHAKPLMDAKLDLALGHKQLVKTKTGAELVYSVPPDGNAIQYLMNQGAGKPRETVDLGVKINLQDDIE